jgi:hypothetical protein
MRRAGVAEDFDTGAPAAILSSMENMSVCCSLTCKA